MYSYLCCRNVNPFLIEALIFVASLTTLDSLRYFGGPTGRLAATKRESATNVVIAAGLSG